MLTRARASREMEIAVKKRRLEPAISGTASGHRWLGFEGGFLEGNPRKGRFLAVTLASNAGAASYGLETSVEWRRMSFWPVGNSPNQREGISSMAARAESLPGHPEGETQAWGNLRAHYEKIKDLHLRQSFREDPKRGERLTAEAAGIFLDYSKNRITDETLKLLIRLAEESRLRERIDAMFRGDKINVTEKRAVLHIALREPRDGSIIVDGQNVVPKVHAVVDRMSDFSNRLRTGEWKGHTGKRIRNVINVGIGGSDLGPPIPTLMTLRM